MGAAPGRERPEEQEVDAWSEASEDEEMVGIREAVAEAIHEAEDQTTEEPTQHAAKVTTIMEEAIAPTAQATRAETSSAIAPPMASQERGEPRIGRTPLQRLQDAPKRRFGNYI
jgi:hypothetical protein